MECDIWRGGAAAVMAFITNKYKSGMMIWLFDYFEGLPRSNNIDGKC